MTKVEQKPLKGVAAIQVSTSLHVLVIFTQLTTSLAISCFALAHHAWDLWYGSCSRQQHQRLFNTASYFLHYQLIPWRLPSALFCVLFLAYIPLLTVEAGMACRLERRTRDRKVASSNTGRSGGRIFFSRVNFVC